MDRKKQIVDTCFIKVEFVGVSPWCQQPWTGEFNYDFNKKLEQNIVDITTHYSLPKDVEYKLCILTNKVIDGKLEAVHLDLASLIKKKKYFDIKRTITKETNLIIRPKSSNDVKKQNGNEVSREFKRMHRGPLTHFNTKLQPIQNQENDKIEMSSNASSEFDEKEYYRVKATMLKLQRKKKRHTQIQIKSLGSTMELLEKTQQNLDVRLDINSIFGDFQSLGLVNELDSELQSLKETRDILQKRLIKAHLKISEA